MQASKPQSALKCDLHDWDGLSTRLRFIYDRRVTDWRDNSASFERRGEYSAWLVRSGRATLRCDGEQETVGPGEWLFCFGRHITQQLSPNMRLLSLRLTHTWPDESLAFHAPHPLLRLRATKWPRLEKLARLMMADLGPVKWQPEDPAYTFQWRVRLDHATYLRHRQHVLEWTQLVAHTLQQLGWGIDAPTGVDDRVARALAVIDRLPLDAPFPGPELPRASGLTIGQLNRKHARASGLTLYAYWERRRVRYARYALAQPTASIKQVALELGFTQLSHFSAWFKRHVGQAPRGFRQRDAGPQ